MKLISWNVNGIRAAYNKGFNDFFDKENADIFCIQETKMQEGQLDITKEGYYVYLRKRDIQEQQYGQRKNLFLLDMELI